MIYVVNLALRRADGKVENDTFFTEKKPTQDTTDEICLQQNCDVVLAVLGIFKPYNDDMQKKSIFFAKRDLSKKEEKPDEISKSL